MNMLTSPRTVIILGSPGVGLSSYSKHGFALERLRVVREVRSRAPNHNGCDLGHSHNVGVGADSHSDCGILGKSPTREAGLAHEN